MTARDGGPAFPMHERDDALRGMSLRDYFAGQALAGMCVGVSGMLDGKFSPYAKGPCDSGIAARCVAVADALIAELEKT